MHAVRTAGCSEAWLILGGQSSTAARPASGAGRDCTGSAQAGRARRARKQCGCAVVTGSVGRAPRCPRACSPSMLRSPPWAERRAARRCGVLTGSYLIFPNVPWKSPAVTLFFIGGAGLKGASETFCSFCLTFSCSFSRVGSTNFWPAYSDLCLSKAPFCGAATRSGAWCPSGHRSRQR